MKKVNRVFALGLAGALTVTASSSIAAPVLTNTAAVKTAVPDDLTQVRWGWGWGLGAFIGGLALGAALTTPSYAYYGYPYGYSYGGYPYSYGYWGGGYPYWGYRTAYWGGYPGWGYRRAYWGGGWGVRRAFWGGWGIRRSWWASARSTRFASDHRRSSVRVAYHGRSMRHASYRVGPRHASYRVRITHASYGPGVKRTLHRVGMKTAARKGDSYVIARGDQAR